MSLRFGNKEFQFPGLIAAKSQPGLVVAFDQEPRATQQLRETRKRFDRGGEVSNLESRKLDH